MRACRRSLVTSIIRVGSIRFIKVVEAMVLGWGSEPVPPTFIRSRRLALHRFGNLQCGLSGREVGGVDDLRFVVRAVTERLGIGVELAEAE
jgi:hypothetical protein